MRSQTPKKVAIKTTWPNATEEKSPGISEIPPTLGKRPTSALRCWVSKHLPSSPLSSLELTFCGILAHVLLLCIKMTGTKGFPDCQAMPGLFIITTDIMPDLNGERTATG